MSDVMKPTALGRSDNTRNAEQNPHEIIIGDRVRVIGELYDGRIGVVENIILGNEIEVILRDGKRVVGGRNDFKVDVPEVDIVALQRRLCSLMRAIDQSHAYENIQNDLGKIMRDFFDIRWLPPHKGRWWPYGFEV